MCGAGLILSNKHLEENVLCDYTAVSASGASRIRFENFDIGCSAKAWVNRGICV